MAIRTATCKPAYNYADAMVNKAMEECRHIHLAAFDRLLILQVEQIRKVIHERGLQDILCATYTEDNKVLHARIVYLRR